MRRLVLIITSFTLVSCETMDMSGFSWPSRSNLDTTCPNIHIVPELSTLTQFDDFYAGPESQDQIQALSLIQTAGGVCRIVDNNTLQVALTLTFIHSLGPQGLSTMGKNASFAFPYFASVSTSSGAIRAKDVFAASVIFDKNTTRVQSIESLKQSLLLERDEKISDIRILIGFQLTPAQLAYNRTNPRPEVSDIDLRNATLVDDRILRAQNP